MAAPPKPWEKAGVNSQIDEFPFTNSSSPDVTVPAEFGRGVPSSAPAPPPLPPRPSQQRSTFSSGYGGYGTGLGSYSGMGGMYGGGMYGSGMYGGYGSYGYGGGMYGGYGAMNRFGTDNGYTQNSFVRQAEENSRQAFQSVESVVQAFGSVAMMLESTFCAVYNSFRAVIGVADQMSRVKTHLAQIFSALAVIKTLRWLYRKLLVLLRLRQGGLPEDAWAQATSESVQAMLAEQELQAGKKSSWPILMFFAVVLGGPWFIWKLLSSMYSSTSSSEWMNGTDDHFLAMGEYTFSGQGQDELSFRRGQRIVIAPKEMQPQIRGWLLASVDGKNTGMVPANYIKILGKKKGTRHAKEVVPVVKKETSPMGPSAAVSFDNEFAASGTNQRSVSNQSMEQVFSGSQRDFPSSSTLDEKTAVDILEDASTNTDKTNDTF